MTNWKPQQKFDIVGLTNPQLHQCTSNVLSLIDIENSILIDQSRYCDKPNLDLSILKGLPLEK